MSELAIAITARNQASSALRSVAGDLRRLTRESDNVQDSMRSTRSSFADLGSVVGGGLIVSAVNNIASSVVNLGAQALDSYASYERLSGSLQSLVAREMIAASGTEKYIKTGTAVLHLTDQEKTKLAELELNYRKLSAEITVQEEHLNEATASGRDSAAELELRRIRIEENRQELASMGAEIDKLKSKDGALVNITKRVIEGQISMSQAMQQAGPRAKDLLNWIQKLAIQSPFSQDDVAEAFKLSLAYGFTSDEAQKLTQTMVDFAAGSGQGGQVMGQVALALGQIQARGKLAGGELMQLTNAMIPAREILANAFGVTTAQLEKMIEKGLIPADKAIQAIVEGLNRDFAGAAQAQSNTFSGLIASLEDIKSIGLREFFTGTFQAIQPYLASFVGTLSDPATQEKIAAFGTIIGTKVAGGLEALSGILSSFQSGGVSGLVQQLGLPPAVIALWDLGAQNLRALEGAVAGLAAVLAASAIANALTAIAAAMAAILSPIGLLVIGAMALGAAWTANFGGIQEKTQAVIEFLRPGFAELLSWISAASQGNFEPLKGGLQGALATVTATIQAFNWADYVPVLTSWGTYITSLPWGSYVATLSSWGTYIAALSWAAILPVLTSWGTYITNLDWTAIIVKIVDWATWVPALGWAAFVTTVAWGAYLAVLAWKTFIGPFTWENWANKLNWALWIGKLTWSGFVTFLKWDLWVLGLAWKDFVDKVAWLDYISKLSAWGSYVPPLTWASFVKAVDLADWIPDFGSWYDYIKAYFSGADAAANPPAHNAAGTTSFRGGLTWVGERGPELIMAPRGARIFNNNESMQMAGAGGVTVHIHATINNGLDVNQLAYQVADIVQRRR